MKLFIFPMPPDAVCTLRHDVGWTETAVPDTDAQGRVGQSFVIPPTTPANWGAHLSIMAEKMVPIELRGILTLESVSTDRAGLLVDDFQLTAEKVCPPPTPIPEPPKPPTVKQNPLQVVQAVYATGNYNLAKKDGCGEFTEECCRQLHDGYSQSYGHIRKSGAQNQFNGHAVDALQLLAAHTNLDGTVTTAGIYDLIVSSESSDAKPSFNRQGDPAPNLWYYPA